MEVVELLLAAGEAVNSKDDDDAPLFNACESGHIDFVRVLIAAGAEVGNYKRFPPYGTALDIHYEGLPRDRRSAEGNEGVRRKTH